MVVRIAVVGLYYVEVAHWTPWLFDHLCLFQSLDLPCLFHSLDLPYSLDLPCLFQLPEWLFQSLAPGWHYVAFLNLRISQPIWVVGRGLFIDPRTSSILQEMYLGINKLVRGGHIFLRPVGGRPSQQSHLGRSASGHGRDHATVWRASSAVQTHLEGI